MSLLWLKRGWLTPGSQTLRTLERFGASDVWDFVDNSYMRAGVVTTNAGLTVTRASTGYAETSDGRLIEFASGELRRTDKGVLVEAAAINLIPRSQEFDTYWTAQELTITPAATTAPDGTLTATSIAPTAITSTHQLASGTLVSSQAAVISVYVKANGYNTIEILERATASNGASFNVALGTVSNLGTGVGTITAMANGWYRCSVAVTATGVRFYIPNSASNFTGDGVSGIFMWGAQFETGSMLSSLIKTAGSSATRAADEVTASLSGVAYPLSFYGEFVRNGDTGVAEGVLQVDASSRAQRANINVSSSDTLSVTARGGANDGDAAVTGAVTVGAITKSAGRIVVDDVQAARAGSLATADTTASIPTSSPDTVRFGDFGATANYGFLYLRRAAIFPSALTDAQLQGITT